MLTRAVGSTSGNVGLSARNVDDPHRHREAPMRDYFDDYDPIFDLVKVTFCAAAVTCFLLAAHRIAKALMLTGEVAALETVEEAYTAEERELLIHKIKQRSLSF
jgi:hypothetical protein